MTSKMIFQQLDQTILAQQEVDLSDPPDYCEGCFKPKPLGGECELDTDCFSDYWCNTAVKQCWME